MNITKTDTVIFEDLCNHSHAAHACPGCYDLILSDTQEFFGFCIPCVDGSRPINKPLYGIAGGPKIGEKDVLTKEKAEKYLINLGRAMKKSQSV